MNRRNGLFLMIVSFLCLSFEGMAQSGKDKSMQAKKDKQVQLYGYQLNSEDEEEDGTWTIAPVYEEAAKYFSENIAGVQLKGRVGYIDKHNRFVILPQFDPDDHLVGFSNGLSAVKKNGRYGFINKRGEFVIEPDYDGAENFDEKFVAIVKKDGKYGMIDLLGEILVPCKHIRPEAIRIAGFGKTYKNAINQVKSNMDAGKYDEVLARIEEANKSIEANVRDEAYVPTYPSDVVIYQEGEHWGMKNAADSCILAPAYDEIISIDTPFYILRKNDKWGIGDVYGRVLLQCKYDLITYEPNSHIFKVKENNLVGVSKDNGLTIVEPCFDYVGAFDGKNMAQVWSGSNEGSVDMDGNISKTLSNLLLGEAHMVASEGDDVRARQLYEKVIKLDKKCGMAYICLGILEVDAQMVEEGIAHIKRGGKVSKELSKVASHNAKEAKKPMGQRDWMDARTFISKMKDKEAGVASVDHGVVDAQFSETLSAQVQAASSSLVQDSEYQKRVELCCQVLKSRYKELEALKAKLTSDTLIRCYQEEMDRLERLIMVKGGSI